MPLRYLLIYLIRDGHTITLWALNIGFGTMIKNPIAIEYGANYDF